MLVLKRLYTVSSSIVIVYDLFSVCLSLSSLSPCLSSFSSLSLSLLFLLSLSVSLSLSSFSSVSVCLSVSLSLDLIEQSTSLLCPQTRTINSNDINPVPEWRIISSSSGKFCTETNYPVHEICVIENNSSTLVIDKKFFTNVSRGEVNISFVHNDTASNMITVRYGKYDIIYCYVIDMSL